MDLTLTCKSAKLEPLGKDKVVVIVHELNPLSVFEDIKEETVIECYGLYSQDEYSKLKNGLHRYGKHEVGCKSLWLFEDINGIMVTCDYKCTCGFDDLVQSIE